MVIAGAIVGLTATDGYFAAAEQVEIPQLYEGIPLDATLLHLDREALKDAYHEYALLIMRVYFKGDIADDERAKAGFRKAREVYNYLAAQIAKREQQLFEQDRQQQDRGRR